MNDYRKFASQTRINGFCIPGTTIDSYMQKVTAGWQSPTIIENSPNFGVAIDIYSRLLQDRIIFIGTEIDDVVGNIVTSQLLYLNSVDSEKPVNLYLNTPGGSVTAGLSIYDSMLHIEAPIYTVCTGMAASMGSVLLCAGEYEHRLAQKHSSIMIHEVSSGQSGKMSDMEDSFRETKRLNEELFRILALHTGHTYEYIQEVALRRDFWMTAEKAMEFGIVDRILEPKKEIKAPVHCNYTITDETVVVDDSKRKRKSSRKK